MSLPSRVGRWQLAHIVATAGEAHGRALPTSGVPEVWVVDATNRAIALGSAQPPDLVDADEAARLGIEIVRRRSGGGAVLITPGDLVWIDVFVPRGDHLWDDDIGRASHWLGAVWAEALASFGHRATVHVGPMEADQLARVVCFAGVGPGEVIEDGDPAEADRGELLDAPRRGPKLVGLSQRRTRAGARFQCAVHLRWDPEPLASLLAHHLEPADRRRLAGVAIGVAASADELVDAFLSHIAAR